MEPFDGMYETVPLTLDSLEERLKEILPGVPCYRIECINGKFYVNGEEYSKEVE